MDDAFESSSVTLCADASLDTADWGNVDALFRVNDRTIFPPSHENVDGPRFEDSRWNASAHVDLP
ncbi:MAG: hypothetical protein C0483_10370 [Pirellula sp.]|nr:hypothetical protein [Pirellula sp.]